LGSWALLTTASNVEMKVAASLAQKQLAHHLFMRREKAVARGRLVEKLKPAFSRYIFVQPEELWADIRKIPGVYNFVHFNNGGPEMVADSIIDELVSSTQGDIFPYVVGPSRFSPGQKLKIAGMGPFRGREGTYERALSELRADILVDLFGRKVHVSVDERDLEEMPFKRRRRRRRRFRHSARLRGKDAQ